MTKRILLAGLITYLMNATMLFGGIQIKEDFTGKPEKFSDWQIQWELKDGVIRTKDGQTTYSAFRIKNLNITQVSITFKIKQLKINPKGGLFGIKVKAENNSQLHLFYQNQLTRCIQTVNAQKGKTENFGRLTAEIPAGENSPWTRVSFILTKTEIKSKVDDKLIGTLPLNKGWDANLPIREIEFHTYQEDACYDDIVIDAEGSLAKIQAQPGDKRLSQLDVVEKMEIAKGPDDFRILYMGDSITRHGFSKDTIKKLGWDHLAGMAATKEEKDYAHLLADKIQKTMPKKKVHIYFHSKGGSGAAAHRLSVIDEFAKFAPHLVVVQLGEHEKEAAGVEALKTNYKKLLEKIQAWPSKPLIICTGVWNPYQAGKKKSYNGWSKTIEKTMQQVCQELSIPFASVEPYALDPSCSGWGTSPGVKWHPNDKGMQGYSEAIFSQFQKNNKR